MKCYLGKIRGENATRKTLIEITGGSSSLQPPPPLLESPIHFIVQPKNQSVFMNLFSISHPPSAGDPVLRPHPIQVAAKSAALFFALAGIASAEPSTTVVISQVYGGGGNGGALYDQDFIELLNKSSTAVDLDGWSIQYASGTGAFSSSNTKALSGVIPAGGYFLIGCAYGADLTPTDLPTPDLTFPSNSTLSLGAAAGKVALVNTTTPLATLTLPNETLVDLVAYGDGATPFEGTARGPVLSSSLSAQRKISGSLDSDDNATDLEALAPAPRNKDSPVFGGDAIR